MYQDLHNKAIKITKKDACMKFDDASRPLYLETDASGADLGAGLLQVKEGMNCWHDEVPDNATLQTIDFTTKSLLGAEWLYSTIEWEALGILHGPEKFHHYCFAKEVCVITDHKSLVTIISKGVATCSQHLWHIILHSHQYRVFILYKTSPDLYIADSLP